MLPCNEIYDRGSDSMYVIAYNEPFDMTQTCSLVRVSTDKTELLFTGIGHGLHSHDLHSHELGLEAKAVTVVYAQGLDGARRWVRYSFDGTVLSDTTGPESKIHVDGIEDIVKKYRYRDGKGEAGLKFPIKHQFGNLEVVMCRRYYNKPHAIILKDGKLMAAIKGWYWVQDLGHGLRLVDFPESRTKCKDTEENIIKIWYCPQRLYSRPCTVAIGKSELLLAGSIELTDYNTDPICFGPDYCVHPSMNGDDLLLIDYSLAQP